MKARPEATNFLAQSRKARKENNIIYYDAGNHQRTYILSLRLCVSYSVFLNKIYLLRDYAASR